MVGSSRSHVKDGGRTGRKDGGSRGTKRGREEVSLVCSTFLMMTYLHLDIGMFPG